MSIDVVPNCTLLICDGCEKEVAVHGDFKDAVEHAKEELWRTIKSVHDGRTTWEHYCPECRKLEGI